jgi:hypothetical protein
MLMAPLVRRSWSVRGHTPVLRQRARCQHKVSAIAALCVLPNRNRIALCFRLHPDANVNTERAMDFLEHLQRQLHTPIVLVWDSVQAHKGELINQCVLPRSAHLQYLPRNSIPSSICGHTSKPIPWRTTRPSISTLWPIEHAALPNPCNADKTCCAASSDIPGFLYASHRTLLMQVSIIATRLP